MSLEKQGHELFIVDNTDETWKALHYLAEWTEISSAFDIATGYFEIGALLALDGKWQKLDKIRILMGDEVTQRTRAALLTGVRDRALKQLDTSIEQQKQTNDFLTGVPGIVEAIRSGKIECRVYNKKKFHAKAYITHSRLAVVGSSALVGSSNFTLPGLTNNVELNVQLRREVELLQEWYEAHWNDAVDVSDEVLKTIERHIRPYQPFEVYAKALQQYFKNLEMTAGAWEKTQSRIFKALDQYQKEGYEALMRISQRFGGAFLCDGVGLGKTFVGLMLIERLVVHDRKNVVLVVPKSGRKPVWEAALKRYLPDLLGDFSKLVIINHTDLQRGGDWNEKLARLKQNADAVVIDEAHHFRNPGVRGLNTGKPSRYWRMADLAENKPVFMLTATPVNNQLIDLQHLMELFTRRQPDYFKDALGIHSLPGHFRKMEKDLAKRTGDAVDLQGELDGFEAGELLGQDELFRSLVVQRSRAYVRESQKQQGGQLAVFPERTHPQVADYSVKKTYGKLLQQLEEAFSKANPLFTLPMYFPLAYYKGSDQVDPLTENRQKQVVGLIRTLFLKRFESSPQAFEFSCEQLMLKLLAFMTKHSQSAGEKRILERWKLQHAELIGYVKQQQLDLFGSEEDEEADEDIVPDEMLEAVEDLDRAEYRVEEMLAETLLDLDQVAKFLDELRQFKPSHDDKLRALISLMKNDAVLKKHKVMIFTEFMATARYLKRELEKAGIEGVDQIDSTTKRDRTEVITQFAPYYNGSSSGKLADDGLSETRVLIATDVLSEGLNLQDATRLINYDLHWNPVRLMQRIGRVDRRLNPEVEAQILKDHKDQKNVRGTVAYWNFLPPDELDNLLKLYRKVSHKTLRISKVFGIEGKKLLTPDDDFDALKDFTHAYEGEPTTLEAMHLEYQRLVLQSPDLPARLDALPGRVFSGKAHPNANSKAVFFCFSLPAKDGTIDAPEIESDAWTVEAGTTRWVMIDVDGKRILEDAGVIFEVIRCEPETPRQTSVPQATLGELRGQVEAHLRNTYFRQVQAPAGVRPILTAWMEMS
jgi:SNF2 family DNA or RNA helicase